MVIGGWEIKGCSNGVVEVSRVVVDVVEFWVECDWGVRLVLDL